MAYKTYLCIGNHFLPLLLFLFLGSNPCFLLQKHTNETHTHIHTHKLQRFNKIKDYLDDPVTLSARLKFWLRHNCELIFSKHIVRILAMPISSLNVLQADSKHSIGWWVHTAWVQVLHVPTFTVFIFSSQTPNIDHNEQLSPSLHHSTQVYKNFKRHFIS